MCIFTSSSACRTRVVGLRKKQANKKKAHQKFESKKLWCLTYETCGWVVPEVSQSAHLFRSCPYRVSDYLTHRYRRTTEVRCFIPYTNSNGMGCLLKEPSVSTCVPNQHGVLSHVHNNTLLHHTALAEFNSPSTPYLQAKRALSLLNRLDSAFTHVCVKKREHVIGKFINYCTQKLLLAHFE